jgi:hypothetical protein
MQAKTRRLNLENRDRPRITDPRLPLPSLTSFPRSDCGRLICTLPTPQIQHKDLLSDAHGSAGFPRVPSLRMGFRLAARTPRKRLNFKTGETRSFDFAQDGSGEFDSHTLPPSLGSFAPLRISPADSRSPALRDRSRPHIGSTSKPERLDPSTSLRMGLVSSTLTRFRQPGDPSLSSGFRLAARTPRKRLRRGSFALLRISARGSDAAKTPQLQNRRDLASFAIVLSC